MKTPLPASHSHILTAYNLARWLLRDPVAAEDVVQDAMLRAMKYLHGFRGENPRAWLLQIVRTTAYSRLSQNRNKAETQLDAAMEHPDDADTPEAALERREGETVLAAALAALPTDLRECLVLRELEQMSYRDIARITEVPIGTVMSRLWRAREALMRHGRSLA
jgi:RNA polymerase sigma factor (sigma-70 family)